MNDRVHNFSINRISAKQLDIIKDYLPNIHKKTKNPSWGEGLRRRGSVQLLLEGPYLQTVFREPRGFSESSKGSK